MNVDSGIDMQFPQHAFVDLQSRSARDIRDVQLHGSFSCSLIYRRTHLLKDLICLSHGLCDGVSQLCHVEIPPHWKIPIGA
jgi:hypothetical protein